MQARQQELLRALRLHFLTQNALELPQAASTERQHTVEPGA